MISWPTLAQLQEGSALLIDKPYRWTSFDAINKLKKLLKVKIGHAGTLDPLATGLLICCTGKMTKQISTFQQLPKEYTGIIHLGAVTPTYDLESEPRDFKPIDGLADEAVRAATSAFIGDILQSPPAHSAIKKDGKRAYELARKGVEVKMEPRKVRITEFELTAVQLPEVHFRVSCSTGTYIRSLAHDFGQALGCGGYLQELRRTKIGDFRVGDAPDVEGWIAWLKEQNDRVAPDPSRG